MRYVQAKDNEPIYIGRQGENNVEVVQFDVTGWADLYGEGAFEVFHKRCRDTVAYPCVISMSEDGSAVEWLVGNADVEYTGQGECQLVYVVDGDIAKSVIFQTCTAKSLDGSGEPPEPYENRIQDLIEAAANITVEANRAEAARKGAEDAEKGALQAQEDAETAQGKAEEAEQSAEQHDTNAGNHALDAEAWAVGERGGEPVPQSDETYNNNAKHYAYLSEQGAEASGYVWFDINDSDGCMYVTTAGHIGEDVTFEVNENLGILEVIYA